MSLLTFADLSRYHVSLERGFLPAEDPLTCLPEPFSLWEQVAADVPVLLMTGRLRKTVAAMPRLDADGLTREAGYHRAMLLFSIIGNGYVWATTDPAPSLPESLARPWWQVAERLGRPPIASHASIVLYNWRRLNPDGPLNLTNLDTANLFLGGLDERWFYLVTVLVEAAGATAIVPMIQAQQAIAAEDDSSLIIHLDAITAAIEHMTMALHHMYEQCDPYIFYHRIRPFLTSWPDPGLLYEGVSAEPQPLAGGSAAQSSLTQALDAALGVAHTSEQTRPFLLEMRRYMPPPHRAFIEALEAGPSLPEFVAAADSQSLRRAYEASLRALETFRKAHMEIAVRYILHQSPDQDSALGTGGTSFVPFLSKAQQETTAGLSRRRKP